MKKILLAFVFLFGCATPYQGTMPDLSLRGESAQKEYSKFHLNESFWSQGHFYLMGPVEEKYTVESMIPVFEKVSPEGLRQLDKAEIAGNIQLITLSMATAAFLACSMTDSASKSSCNSFVLATASASIISGFISFGYMWSSAENFNQDLKKQLNPSVTFNINF